MKGHEPQKNSKLKKLHEGNSGIHSFEHNEGQRLKPLCSNRVSGRCPSLCYEQVEGVNQKEVDEIFDILFEEVIRLENNNQL